MFVKICGTTNLADAQLAVELGADALGFIFAPSKRQVVATQVAAMTPQLPERILRVGVFTEPDAPEIMRIVEAADLDAVSYTCRIVLGCWSNYRRLFASACSFGR